MKKSSIAIGCLLFLGSISPVLADTNSEVDALKRQMAAMQEQMQKQMQQQMQQMQQMQNKINSLTEAQTQAHATSPAVDPTSKGGLSTTVGGADLTVYGMVDLSVDSGDNGRQRISQVSSNESYVGLKGGRNLGASGLRAIFQVETMAEISGTPTAASSIASRNSFAGIEGNFGKVMIGKYDTPYKRSTAQLDPFAGSIGDYNSIMGNSAGEGRAEFDYRMPHSIFYDSPSFNGFTVNALFSPGQKLNDLPPTAAGASNYAFPQGELVCSGTQQTSLNGATPNTSGSGTAIQTTCNDGAFKNATSIAFNYAAGPLYATAAWESHQDVNRTSDKGGVVSAERAAKLGVSYDFPIGNKLSAIYEKLYRDGGVNPAYNERARSGFYLSDVQQLHGDVDLMGAWAHGGQTPGSPKFPGLADTVDMYTVGLKYHYDKQASLYLIAAYLKQDPGAHYGLGAGEGHGTPVLSPRTDTGGPFPGQTLKALSAGIQYGF